MFTVGILPQGTVRTTTLNCLFCLHERSVNNSHKEPIFFLWFREQKIVVLIMKLLINPGILAVMATK